MTRSFIIFLTTIALSLPISLNAAEPDQYVVMTVVVGGTDGLSEIAIIYPEGVTKTIDLKNAALKNIVHNSSIIARAINDLAAEGYELVTSNGGDLQVRYIFKREG